MDTNRIFRTRLFTKNQFNQQHLKLLIKITLPEELKHPLRIPICNALIYSVQNILWIKNKLIFIIVTRILSLESYQNFNTEVLKTSINIRQREFLYKCEKRKIRKWRQAFMGGFELRSAKPKMYINSKFS